MLRNQLCLSGRINSFLELASLQDSISESCEQDANSVAQMHTEFLPYDLLPQILLEVILISFPISVTQTHVRFISLEESSKRINQNKYI